MVREEVRAGSFRWEDSATGNFVIVVFCNREVVDNRLGVSCSPAGPGPGVRWGKGGWFVSSVEDNVVKGAHQLEHKPAPLGGGNVVS